MPCTNGSETQYDNKMANMIKKIVSNQGGISILLFLAHNQSYE